MTTNATRRARQHKIIAEREKEIALLRDLLRRREQEIAELFDQTIDYQSRIISLTALVAKREQEIAELDKAIDAAGIETHATTPASVAELEILLDHALERHKTLEAERRRFELDALVFKQDWNYVVGRIHAKEAKPCSDDADPSYRAGWREEMARIEPTPYTPRFHAAMRETCSTPASRATTQQIGMTEAEALRILASKCLTSAEDPPPAKDDSQ